MSFVTEVRVKPGTRVQTGQILYRLQNKEQHALGSNENLIDITAGRDGIVLDVQAQPGSYVAEVLTDHVEKDRRIPEKEQQKQGFARKLWRAIRPGRAISGIRRLWGKIPDGWYKNPYAWAGIIFTLVFFALFAASWMRWHEYREENRRLRTVADKYQVTTVILNELYPELAVTVGAYEKLVETVGVDSTLTVFRKQLKAVREASDNKNK